MKFLFIFSILLFFLSSQIMAQEKNDLLDMDLDSIFNGSSAVQDNTASTPTDDSAAVNVNKSGITFGVSYEFQGGLAPGWSLAPWHFDGTEDFSWGYGAKMTSKLSINAQISEVFKVYTSFDFKIPDFSLTLGDFFFDYNFYNRIFVRAGKYELSWGISSFTNLLARVPEQGPSGPSYIVKADIPIGIGGFQALALTRSDLAGNVMPEQWGDLAFGGKYNVALRWVDLDLGVFYQHNMMPTRGFLSIKTTLGETEVYNEWLAAVNTHTDNAVSFAANLGFIRNFFNDKLTMGGEVFYNGEDNTYFFKPETRYKDAETVPLLEQIILGLNFLYRITGKGSPRLFSSVSYSVAENSAQLVPGFKFTPFQNIDVYCAVPMALGNKEGYYYTHNADLNDRPFSIMLLVTLTGSVYASSF